MEEIKIQINQTLSVIQNTTTLFYQNKLQEGFKELDPMLQMLNETIDIVYANKSLLPTFDETKLVSVLTEALMALEKKDTLLFADLLQYEIVELLETICESLL